MPPPMSVIGIKHDSREIHVNRGEGKLKQCERTAGHEQCGPDLQRLPPGTHALHHVERHQEGKERQLVAGHDAERFVGSAVTPLSVMSGVPRPP